MTEDASRHASQSCGDLILLKGHISKNHLQIHCNLQSSNDIAHRNRKKKKVL